MFHRSFLLASLVVCLAVLPSDADTFNAYAGPNAWGPPVQLNAHLGPVTYTVSTTTVVGKTVVVGEVTYTNAEGRTVTQKFSKSITFRTGNVVDRPTVRFKGNPTGSAVRISVSP